MPRISMQQAYDNRDVIAQIYKMLADVADSVAKATEAVAKALEAMETAEDAGEAAEAAQEAVAGKQDALTAEQLLAVNSGITAEGVTQIGTNATAIEGLDDRTGILASTEDANVGDALMLDENKEPVWGVSGMQAHRFNTIGELATAMEEHPDGLFVKDGSRVFVRLYYQSTNGNNVYFTADFAHSAYNGIFTFYGWNSTSMNMSISKTQTTSTTSFTVNKITIRGSTDDSTLVVTSTTNQSEQLDAEYIIGYY